MLAITKSARARLRDPNTFQRNRDLNVMDKKDMLRTGSLRSRSQKPLQLARSTISRPEIYQTSKDKTLTEPERNMENLHARDSLGGLELMASESKTTTTNTNKKTSCKRAPARMRARESWTPKQPLHHEWPNVRRKP